MRKSGATRSVNGRVIRNPVNCWIPEPIFQDETVFVIGGGPSVTQSDVDRLKGRKVIVVNSSHLKAPWADILFFMDNRWYEKKQDVVKNWPKIVATTNEIAARKDMKISYIVPDKRPGFFESALRRGGSSGHNAVALAIACKAKRVVLLGFDMRVVNGRTHHHDDYKEEFTARYHGFMTGFKGWNADALKVGVEILNATPDSELKEFPFVRLDDVL